MLFLELDPNDGPPGLFWVRTVLSDPLMRHEYDMQGNYGLQDYNYTVSNDIALIYFVSFLTVLHVKF